MAHLSPNAPAVDVYVDGAETLTDVPYGVISDYLELGAGDHQVQVYVSPADTSGDAVIDATVTVEEDGIYTVAAVGSADPTDAGTDAAIGALPIVEDFEDPAGTDTAMVRIVHASYDAPGVQIDVYDPTMEAPCADEASIEVNTTFAFKEDTGAGGIELPAGVIYAAVCVDGDFDDSNGFQPFAFEDFTIDLTGLDGAEILLFADGSAGQAWRLGGNANAVDAFKLFAAADSTEQGPMIEIERDPLYYIAHAAPDVGPVDVCQGTTAVVPAFAYAGSGATNMDGTNAGFLGPFQLPIGIVNQFTLHPVAATDCDGTGVPFTVNSTDLERGGTHIVTATGLVAGSGGTELQQRVYTDGITVPESGNAHLVAVHQSPDTPEVDVGAAGVGDGFGLFPDLDFAATPANYATNSSAAGGTVVPAGTYDIQAGVSAAEGEDATAAAVTFEGVGITDGLEAFAFVIGKLTPAGAGEALKLLVVNVGPDDGDAAWAALPAIDAAP